MDYSTNNDVFTTSPSQNNFKAGDAMRPFAKAKNEGTAMKQPTSTSELPLQINDDEKKVKNVEIVFNPKEFADGFEAPFYFKVLGKCTRDELHAEVLRHMGALSEIPPNQIKAFKKWFIDLFGGINKSLFDSPHALRERTAVIADSINRQQDAHTTITMSRPRKEIETSADGNAKVSTVRRGPIHGTRLSRAQVDDMVNRRE
jgi:hypothetical protein